MRTRVSRSDDPIGIVVALQARLDREAVAGLLRTQPGFEVLGTAATGPEVVSRCLALRPGVLLLGTLVPWPPDVRGVNVVRMCCPGTEVLAMAPHAADRCAELNPPEAGAGGCGYGFADGHCLRSALAHGACGAIHRDCTPAELFRAVRAVARGERWVGPGVEMREAPPTPLSRRELEVALMISKGSSNKDISRDLGISAETVKKHVGQILRKLQLKDRLQVGLAVARHPLDFGTD